MNSSEKPSPTFNPETDAADFLGRNLEAVRGLANFIDLSEGFRIAIAEVNFAPDVDILIQALQQRPECQQVQFLVFDFSHQKIPSLLTELVERLTAIEPEADKKPVIILRGLETSIGGLGNESPFLQDLNFVRDALARRVSYPMVFILPKYALKRFARQARDFWSWASTVFEFRSARERIETVQTSVLQTDNLPGNYRKPVKQSRIDQLNSLLEEYAPTDKDSDSVNADIRLDILLELGEAHLSLLQNKPAEQCFSAAIALAQGSEKPLYEARAHAGLAEALYLQGCYGEAEPLYQQALAMRQALLGEAHPAVATSLNNLAELYRAQGRYGDAEPLYQQSLEIGRKVYGDEHPEIATDLNNLALLYKLQGRYSEAEPLLQQALEMRQALLGEDHPNVAVSYGNLAGVYEATGQYEKAEPLRKKALQIHKEQLGESHPYIATGLNNLAELYRAQGRYSEAEPLYQQALALRQALLGETHPDVATSLNNLALLYQSQGRYSEAEPLYLKALKITVEALGDDYPDVAYRCNNLAGLYLALERFEEAEPLYLQAISVFYQRLGENHPNTQTVVNNFAGFLRAVIEVGQAHILSDRPLTQDLLRQLQ